MIQVKIDIGKTKFNYCEKELCDICNFNMCLLKGGAKCLIFNKNLKEIVIDEECEIIGYERLEECKKSEI